MRRRVWRAASLAGLLGLASCGGEQGSLRPEGSDAKLLNIVFWIMVAFGVAVVCVVIGLLWYVRRGRSTDDDVAANERKAERLVVLGGVVLPVVVLVPLAVLMLLVGNHLSASGEVDETIEVTAHQFWWEVRYADGVVTANEIHIPVGERVRIRLGTDDVIHSFWVPSLAGKIDMIPGQSTDLVLEAAAEGTYLGQCAEFCGVQHARMRFLVVAQPRAEFDAWLAEQSRPADEPSTEAARRGAEAFDELGCAACHTVRGTQADGELGPDLTHVAGRSTLGAATVDNERGELAGWIADPQAAKPGNLMPPTPLSGRQLQDLIAYIEGLR